MFIFLFQFAGEGARRKVFLKPLTLLKYEIEEIIQAQPQGIPINSVVPTYKEKFGKDFQITNYGFPKLIKALEAITDIIEVSV